MIASQKTQFFVSEIMIFVQIAAYRDPELVPTILDCISNAKYKSDLRFGICWQRDEKDDGLMQFKGDKAFRIDAIPWYESKGLCWARARIQRLYEGEAYTLQLDSHHRFEKDWDAKLIHYLELTNSPKPILTAYAGGYEARTNKKVFREPYKMVAGGFTPSGTIIFRPQFITGWKDLTKPIRARFVSGHFFFTLGAHCYEYKYDPNLYFAGDEISLSIRSYTMGYDLFHPHRVVVLHDYTRQGRALHWGDHTLANKELVQMAWHERDALSKRRLRKLLGEEDNDEHIGEYGLGEVRSHQDYERYAGIDFARRRLHRDAVQGVEPPCQYLDEHQWEGGFVTQYELTLKWRTEDINQCNDLLFVFFGVEDASGNLLYRYDASSESLEAQGMTDIKDVQFTSSSQPKKLILWPVSRSRGWLAKKVYLL